MTLYCRLTRGGPHASRTSGSPRFHQILHSEAPRRSRGPPAHRRTETRLAAPKPPRIRFAAMGLNHDHINSQVETVTRGGGELVAFYAKEPTWSADFAKKFPQATLASSEKQILEDHRSSSSSARPFPTSARRSASR